MNRRELLKSLPIVALTPALLASKLPEYNGVIYWKDDELFDDGPDVLQSWRVYWAFEVSDYHTISLYADSVNCHFQLESKFFRHDSVDNPLPYDYRKVGYVGSIYGSKQEILKAAKTEADFRLPPNGIKGLERAIDRFTLRYDKQYGASSQGKRGLRVWSKFVQRNSGGLFKGEEK